MTPEPTGTEARVCEFIASRQALGIQKYSTTVADNPLPLVEWLKHLRAELGDALVYAQRAIEEMEKAQSENALLRAILRDRCFFTGGSKEFSRHGYSLLVEPETALRDIEYRDAPLHATPEEAIDAAMECFRRHSDV